MHCEIEYYSHDFCGYLYFPLQVAVFQGVLTKKI